jgi:ribosomal protein S18 acetylase RimI-like enzyme
MLQGRAMTTQTMDAAITCRRMNESDLPAAHALSQGVRWPYRFEDWQFLLRLGNGFVAEESDAVIGTGLCWKQGDRHGSLGAIIVSPEHQGHGIGRKLMNLVLEELGERCTLLNATPAGRPLYESLGFKPIGTIHQHQGTMRAAPPVVLARGESIRPVTANDIARLVVLANRATGMRRDEVLEQLACVAQGAALERNGELVGFSMVRRFGLGHAIGPVVAPDSERAAALVRYWNSLRRLLRALGCHRNQRPRRRLDGDGTGAGRYRGDDGAQRRAGARCWSRAVCGSESVALLNNRTLR